MRRSPLELYKAAAALEHLRSELRRKHGRHFIADALDVALECIDEVATSRPLTAWPSPSESARNTARAWDEQRAH